MSSIPHVSTVKLLTWLGFFQRVFVTTGALKWLWWFLAIFNFPQTDVLRLQKTIWSDQLQQVRIKPALWLLCLCQTADSWLSPTVTPEVKLHPCLLHPWLAKFCTGKKVQEEIHMLSQCVLWTYKNDQRASGCRQAATSWCSLKCGVVILWLQLEVSCRLLILLCHSLCAATQGEVQSTHHPPVFFITNRTVSSRRLTDRRGGVQLYYSIKQVLQQLPVHGGPTVYVAVPLSMAINL